LGRGAVQLFGAILVAEAHQLHVELGYPSLQHWIRAEVAPRVAAAQSTLSRMTSAAKMHRQLQNTYGQVLGAWTLLSTLAGEQHRQQRHAGLLTAGEFEDACARAAAGTLGREDLEQALRARRTRDRQRRIPGKAARTAPIDVEA